MDPRYAASLAHPEAGQNFPKRPNTENPLRGTAGQCKPVQRRAGCCIYNRLLMSKQRIISHFNEIAELKIQAASELAGPIEQAIELMFTALSNGNRILACGNGGSAADCQHFAAELVGRFERERLPLPAMTLSADASILTAVGNEYGFGDIFAKQVQAYGQAGDVLLAITTSGGSANVIAAIEAALEREMRVVALTGRGGGSIPRLLTDADVHICVPHERTSRIQEVHLLIVHCLCDGIDVALFGGDTE